MTELKNDRLIRAMLRQPTDRRPVWIMRQAGRYLPEYRKVRAKAGSFMALASNPELACEVTLQPLRRFPLDAAILFSDILTIPHAMGLGLTFVSGEGPVFDRPVRRADQVKDLPVPDPETELGYVMDAVRLIRRELDGKVPLIGFAGSPWTVMTYMVEGGSSKNFSQAKAMLYNQPEMAQRLLDKLVTATTDYLNAQIAAGVQAVMLFDTWGGILPPAVYRRFSLEPMQRVAENLQREADGRKVPLTLFTKGAGPRLAEMAETGADCLGVDWTCDLAQARKYTQDKVALQGNLDPSVLHANHATIDEEVARVCQSYGTDPGHVFNLGHGITPDVEPEKLGRVIAAAQSFEL